MVRKPIPAPAAPSAPAVLARLLLGGADRPTGPAVIAAAASLPPGLLARTALLLRGQAEDNAPQAAILLLCLLSRRDPAVCARIFADIIKSGDDLLRFVGCLRDGVTGRRSLGSRPKALVRDWLERATDRQLLLASVAGKPTLADVIRMVRPRAATTARAAFYGWLLGRPVDAAHLPPPVRALAAFRAAPQGDPPDVPLSLLASQRLDAAQWAVLTRRADAAELARRLNQFFRHGAFADAETLAHAVTVLDSLGRADKGEIGPHRLLALLRSLDPAAPPTLRAALEDAVTRTLARLPALTGAVFVFPNDSSVMTRRATANRRGAETALRCHDVAALWSQALTRGNRSARILPYSDHVSAPVTDADLASLTKRLSLVQGRPSRMSVPLDWLKSQRKPVELVVILSANATSGHDGPGDDGADVLAAWQRIKAHNPKARLVCVQMRPDIPCRAPVTLPQGPDILHLHGSSDDTFRRIRDFAVGRDLDYWLAQIDHPAR